MSSQAHVDYAALHRRLDEAEQAIEHRREHSERLRTEVMAKRAEALAAPLLGAEEDGVGLLIVRVGGERVAIEVLHVVTALVASQVSVLPAAHDAVLGTMFVQARVVPLLNLRKLLGTDEAGHLELRYAVVVQWQGEHFALAVEKIDGYERMATAKLTPLTSGPFSMVGPNQLGVLSLGPLGALNDQAAAGR